MDWVWLSVERSVGLPDCSEKRQVGTAGLGLAVSETLKILLVAAILHMNTRAGAACLVCQLPSCIMRNN